MAQVIHTCKGVNKFDWQVAADMYRAGQSAPNIGKALGVTHGAVFNALRKMGVQTRTIGQARSGAALGMRRINAYGYVAIRIGYRKDALEHRLIAARALGRPLKRTEHVHHINCNRADNRHENLLICALEYHNALHARMRSHPYWSTLEK